jgi:hypothetical protein
MEELLKKMQEIREQAYKAWREAEQTAEEESLAYASGIVEGMDIMITLVKETMK